MENQVITVPHILDYIPITVRDKCILVTGGTTGIGRAIALLLASQGAHVMILGRHQQQLDEAIDSFHEAGLEQQVHGIIGDTSNAADIRKIFA